VIGIVELPDENELVIAVIKKIMPYGAFIVLPEYNNLEAFLHVSEVASRWIKNIHEFISEGQRHVMKVYRVDRTKGQVDVSLKRVSEEEKKQKLEFIRTEKRGEMLLEQAIKSVPNLEVDQALIRTSIEAEFDDVYSCFKEASFSGEKALEKLDIPKELKLKIVEVGKKSIKKPTVDVKAILTITSYNPDGVSDINKLLDHEGITVHYLGAPRYQISLTASDYKKAEKKLMSVLEDMEKFAEKNNCDFKYEREDN
jgi:translation initiation factor 2 subunit 1